MPDFQRAVENYNTTLTSFKAANVRISGVDDSIDMMFDLFMGGGFDFMSVFTLSALGNAKSDLEELRGQVEKVDTVVGEHLRKSEVAVSAYKKQVRLACRS